MSKYSFYTTNEIKPCGWIKRQLEIQAEGLSGNLDKIWPDIRDSAWIGGNREGWERVPYWLDGFIPLAYLLDNADMKTRVKKYIDAILAAQKESGWICPCSEDNIPEYDTWAVQLISKVLVVYYECSGDERIPVSVYRMMKNYYELLRTEKIKLFNWGKFRWYEAFIAINFLKARYNESWLDELAKILEAQGHDYRESVETWKRPLNKWTYNTHVVNLAMMLKTEAVTGEIFADKYAGEAEKLYSLLMKYNGCATDIFTGDECLSGISPIQGTELCAVAELMYSFELLYAYTGDKIWAERLENVAFNALPATISDDMWTHQYVQMANQISAQAFPGKSLFRTNGSEAHLFGLEPNYGCCTANFNQAWPKFALSAFMHEKNGIIATLGIPCSLDTEDVKITLDTEYPFKNSFVYTVNSDKDFTFRIRIPSFAMNITVNSKNTAFADMLCFEIEGGKETRLEISFTTTPEIVSRPNNLKSIKYGSLIFSLPIAYDRIMHEYERDGVERKYPYCDYEYVGKSEWRYGIADEQIEVEEGKISSIPFSSENPPVKLKLKLKRINWDYEDGYDTVAEKLPNSAKAIGETEEKEFYPYGCAKLRITELPMCE